MNRLKKLAKEESNEIHSLDEYFYLYGCEEMTNFITDECVKIASSDEAIDWYIKDCDTPADRSYALETVGEEDVYHYLDVHMDDIVNAVLRKYKATLTEDFDENSLGSAILSLVDNLLYKRITKDVTRKLDDYLMDKLKNKDEKFYHLDIDPFNIKVVKDSVGDTNKLTSKIDYDSRTAAFVDIDGEIIVSGDGASHAQLINEYLSKNEEGKLGDDWYRPEAEEVSVLTGAEKIAFGHICQCDVWVIEETACTNISVDEVVSDIKKSGNEYSKIYSCDADEITRLANLVK